MKRDEMKMTEDNINYRMNRDSKRASNGMQVASADTGPGISARDLADMPGTTIKEKIEKALGVTIGVDMPLEQAIKLLQENKKQ